MIDSQQLLEVANEFRTRSVEALRVPEVQAKISRKKSEQLIRIAEGAGSVLIMGDETIEPARSRSGLVIVPTHPDINQDSRLAFGNGKNRCSESFGKIMQNHNICHVFPSKGRAKNDAILIPVDIFAHLATDERAAVGVHELTHAAQYRRLLKPRDGTVTQHQTRQEAEAYRHQFEVQDYHWKGVLKRIVDDNLSHDVCDTVNVGEYANEMLQNTTSYTLNVVAAVAISARHGYAADGRALPSPTIVADYEKLGLIVGS